MAILVVAVLAVAGGLFASANWLGYNGPGSEVASLWPGNETGADGDGNYADWQTLEVEVVATQTGDGLVFESTMTGSNETGAEVPGERIANRTQLYHLSADEHVGTLTTDLEWSACDPVDCSFDATDDRHVYVAWERTAGDLETSGPLGGGVWIDRDAGNLTHWVAPGRWDFEEEWTGTYTFLVGKAVPVEFLDFEDLAFETAETRLVDETCDSIITTEGRCFRVNVTVTSEADQAAEMPRLQWSVEYAGEANRTSLPFAGEVTTGELEPGQTVTRTIGVPVDAESDGEAEWSDPERIVVQPRDAEGEEGLVELEIAQAWEEAKG